jgi:Tol biopolymer transport system component
MRRLVPGLAVLAALVLAAPAGATFPGRPGLIAFDTPNTIWTVSPGGGGATKIGVGIGPAWSPDGKLVAYVKGDHRLMAMRGDGSGVREVLDSDHIGEPCFSADGKTIFFVKDTSGEGYADIWSVPLAGGEPRRLTHTGSKTSEVASIAPEAAPNGRFVVFQRDGGIWTMRPNGTRQRELARGSTPSISPSGHLVAFARNEKLVTVRAGGGGERIIDPFGHDKREGELIRGVGYPTFSPDGRSIVFTLKKTTDAGPHLHDTKRLAIYTLATGKLRELTSPEVGGAHADWQPLP